MKETKVKEELHKLIDEEHDLSILEDIKLLLERNSDTKLKQILTSRALKSEQDINEGRLLSIDEAKRFLKSSH
ncbi:MAG: hypothetical protein SFW35_06805 [Chitinophagales bacterium]|nr:hypothetical protein [Chitinophagales bacterium]